MCTGLRLRLVENLIIMLLSPTLAAREGITIRLLRRQSVVSGGVSQGRHFVGKDELLGSSRASNSHTRR